MDVPFRISRDILKRMPKEAKKRRFYRKLNGLNKNCESLIFHNKKEDYETVIRDTFEDTLYLHVTENKSEKLLQAYLRRAKERSEAKKRTSIGPPGIYNLYVLGYPKISKYIHNLWFDMGCEDKFSSRRRFPDPANNLNLFQK
ncbi:hypothetical protein NQ317_008044 [Molorchus minor]|uniref:Uncharacterized protein n=1 Tax=Molorchus minor TaxID=1323400 RepID=A0ABQ9JR44_9CUCU|nr:hypothetical protein NQ317_008044 [Molorchus minor]